MSAPWEFFKRFFLIPTLVCAGLGYVAIQSEGVWQALAVGTLLGIAITAWALSSILAWKMKHDRDEWAAAERFDHERMEERDREAVRQEWTP